MHRSRGFPLALFWTLSFLTESSAIYSLTRPSVAKIGFLAYGFSAKEKKHSHLFTTTTTNSEPTETYVDDRSPADELDRPVNRLNSFRERSSRLGFKRKVFAIVMTQLLGTVAATKVFMGHSSLAYYLLSEGRNIMLGLGVAAIATVVTLVSHPTLRYTSPTNYLLLGLFTICQAITVGVFSSTFPARSVFLGSAHTLMAFLAVLLYSLQPNPAYDLTIMGSGLLAALMSLLVGTVANIFFGSTLMENIMLGGGAVLFVAYMAYDMQMIFGGKNVKKQYSEKDHIIAALSLYQDIINLYIRLVQIADKMNNSRGHN